MDLCMYTVCIYVIGCRAIELAPGRAAAQRKCFHYLNDSDRGIESLDRGA